MFEPWQKNISHFYIRETTSNQPVTNTWHRLESVLPPVWYWLSVAVYLWSTAYCWSDTDVSPFRGRHCGSVKGVATGRRRGYYLSSWLLSSSGFAFLPPRCLCSNMKGETSVVNSAVILYGIKLWLWFSLGDKDQVCFPPCIQLYCMDFLFLKCPLSWHWCCHRSRHKPQRLWTFFLFFTRLKRGQQIVGTAVCAVGTPGTNRLSGSGDWWNMTKASVSLGIFSMASSD